ncbi:hypothetical protein A2U01_0012815, partial [Trifolium medium]|nr:hypothetical protein [Trifolium medium]
TRCGRIIIVGCSSGYKHDVAAFAKWPGDRPHFTEGASTATGVGVDDDVFDQAAADAFIDEMQD